MNLPGVSQVLRLAETDSTQTVARFLAEQGARDKTLVWADRQTAGRGRMSRNWESRPGGLYFSLILRPAFPPSRLAELSLLTATAAARAISERTGIETAVKPPNDVYAVANGKGRKVCGILAEASGGSRRVDWVVVGVGVNVNNRVRLRAAASLNGLTGREWPVADILRGFLERFCRSYAKLSER